MKKSKIKGMEALLTVLVVAQFLGIAYSNLFLIDQNLDCDNAKLLKHIMTMWEQRTLLVPQWAYTTTLEWDCTTIFAILFYAITGDIYLSCGLSNLLLTLLFVGAVFYLFRGKEILYPLLSVALLLIPYRVGMLDYYNMLFFAGSQYIVKVTIPILLIGLLLDAGKPMVSDKLFLILGLVYLALLFVTSASSGIYVTACGLVPVFIGYLCYKFFKWEKVPVSAIIMMLGSGAAVVAGLMVNNYGMGGARGQSMILMNAYQLFGNISNCFVGIFELFGGMTENMEVGILTMEGILMVGKLALTVIVLVCGCRALAKCIQKQGDLRTLMLVCVFFWNYFILNVTNTRAGSETYEYRYHLIGMIPLLCIAAQTFVTGMRTLMEKQQKLLFLAGLLALAFLSAMSYKQLFARGEQNPTLKALVEYCEPMELEYVYLYNESDKGDICRLLGENAQYMCIGDDGRVWAYGYYEYFQGSQMPSTNAIIAVREDKADLGDEFEMLGHKLVKFDKVENRTLYYFATN